MATNTPATSKTSHAKEGIAPSKPIKVSARPLDSRLFSWDPIFAGECELVGGLTVFNDGHADWEAQVSSRNVGSDSWGCKFHFQDDHGVQVWEFGWIWSPTLNPISIRWVSQNQLFFPAYIFPSIWQAYFNYHC